jgi:hypothetical protein
MRINGKMLVLTTVVAFMATCLLSSAVVQAGTLNPAPVAQTGQASSYGSRDDGELQKGVEWPDPRFTDNLDGTVTDHLTGLVWLQDATRFSNRGWNPALTACNNLAADGAALTDGSLAGDWRLPNNRELRSLIDFGNSNPALPAGHPFAVPASGSFWSSTTATNNTGRAWKIDDGSMLNDPKTTSNLVWPVRDGFSGGPAPVQKTGQTISYGTRDDGELQTGVDWPDPRFTDNLDGTVTDNLTGLIWLTNGIRFSNRGWNAALNACNNLADDGAALTDGSLAGDWRLPNIWELGSLSDFSELGPALPDGHPFTISNAGNFWSGTTTAANGNRAWIMGMGIGKISGAAKGGSNSVWPVRDGIPVAFDVKPGSCPNPLNVKSRGVLPVAILGSAGFDIEKIDTATIRLLGVAPICSSMEDVGTPFEPYSGKEDCGLDCNDWGPDGWMDLTLKFRTQDMVSALGAGLDAGCTLLTITGNLKEEYNGTPFQGEDVVLILISGGGGRNATAAAESQRRTRRPTVQEDTSPVDFQAGR